MSDFLDDGYTEAGYLKAVDGIHGCLEFEYRPALVKTADRITGLIQGERPDWERFADSAAKAMATDPGLLKSWSMKNRKGESVPITVDNLLRVRNQLFHKLWMVIAGQMPSDGQPSKPNLEADAKNLQPG